MSHFAVLSSKLLFAFFAIFLFGAGSSVFACMCGKASTCELFNFADVSFVGKAIRIEKDESGSFKKEFTIFEMKEVFIGEKVETIRIQNKTGFSCDTSFELGETYLVFARGSKSEGFGTGFCSGNRPLQIAAAEIYEMRKLSGSKGGGKLQGIVLKELSQNRDDRIPMGGVRMEVSDLASGRKYEVRTNENGRFELAAPPGQYKVSPVVPSGYVMSSSFDEDPKEIKSGGCSESYFVLSNNSRITGLLLDVEGKPVRYARVELILADEQSSFLGGLSGESDPNGYFSIDQVPVGKYTLSVNYNSQPRPENPFPTSFYPSGSLRSDAKVFEVRSGSSIEGLTWRLPARLDESVVSGSVVWADGSPVDGAEIKIFDVAFPHHYAGCHLTEARDSASPSDSSVRSTSYGLKGPACNLKSDAQGIFSLRIYSERTYRVTASMVRTTDNTKVEYVSESEPFQLTAAATKIKLVLKPK